MQMVGIPPTWARLSEELAQEWVAVLPQALVRKGQLITAAPHQPPGMQRIGRLPQLLYTRLPVPRMATPQGVGDGAHCILDCSIVNFFLENVTSLRVMKRIS